MNREATSANLIMKCFAVAMPLAFAVYWPLFVVLPDVIGPILRPGAVFAAAVMAVCMLSEPLTAAEMKLLRVFGLMWVVCLLTSALADQPMNALAGFLKLFVIQIFALMMTRALRYEPAARALGTAMYIGSIFTTLFIIYAYLRFMGPVIPTYVAVRDFKGVAEKNGYALNATPACAIMAFLCSSCLQRMTKMRWAVGALVVVAGSFLTGSRAALAVPFVAGVLLLIIVWFRSNTLWRRFFAVLMAAVIVAAIIYVVGFVSSKTLADATEGRWDLWRAGISKFSERPVVGWGFGSWKDDLVSRLPGEYQLTAELAKNIVGGYHNEFVAVLSEHGLIGLGALLLLDGFAFTAAWKLTFGKTRTWHYGYAALFGMLFLLVRANVELDGFFGLFQDPVDYEAYILLAIMVSRFSIEETLSLRAAQAEQSQRFAVERARFNERRRPVSVASDHSTLGEI